MIPVPIQHGVRYAAGVVLVALAFIPPAAAQQPPSPLPDAGSLTARSFQWENDFPYTDRFYTNGLQLAWDTYRSGARPLRSRTPLWLWALDRLPLLDLDTLFPACPTSGTECWQWLQGGRVGQVFYTPRRISTADLQPNDRPYAGWLYYASSAEWQSTMGTPRQWSAELALGFIGPISFSEEIQRNWHEQIDATDPAGWDTQLKRATPSFAFRLDHRRRLLRQELFTDHFVADLNGLSAVTLGNVHNRIELGGELRLGMPLSQDPTAADFPIVPIEPTLVFEAVSVDAHSGASGPSDFPERGDSRRVFVRVDSVSSQMLRADVPLEGGPLVGWYQLEPIDRDRDEAAIPRRCQAYVFARTTGRYVAYNYFLEGGDRYRIDAEPLVYDVAVGGTLRYRWLQLTLQHVWRSREFTPTGPAHQFSSLALHFLPKAAY